MRFSPDGTRVRKNNYERFQDGLWNQPYPQAALCPTMAPPCLHGGPDDPIIFLGWAAYGTGTRAIAAVIFTIAPLMLTSAARLEEGEPSTLDIALMAPNASVEEGLLHAVHHHSLHHAPHLRPSSIPTFTVSVGLLMQCVTAPVLALMADARGLRRVLLAAHVVLGVASSVVLGGMVRATVVHQNNGGGS